MTHYALTKAVPGKPGWHCKNTGFLGNLQAWF